MDAHEVGVECLKLALVQAKNENAHGDIERVAKIQARFYNLIIEGQAPVPAPETEKGQATGKRKPVDKTSPLFGG